MQATSFAEKLEKHSIQEPNSGCLLWTGATAKGYGSISYYRAGRSHTVQAHRLSWEVNRGPIPDGLCVCHKCDVPTCINPGHLFLGTEGENSRDMSAKGRHDGFKRRGAKHPLAKLSDEQAALVRCSTEKGVVLAARFAVSPSTISLIRSGRIRAHAETARG